MVSFDVTSLHKTPINDVRNIIKDYVCNNDQFTRKMVIPQDEFLDLFNLVLTAFWYTFLPRFSTFLSFFLLNWLRCDGRTSIFNRRRNVYAVSWKYCSIYGTTPSKSFGTTFNDFYSIPKRTHLENVFPNYIKNLEFIRFTMEKENNGELAFLDTILKRNDGIISVLVYKKPTHTNQYLHCSSHYQIRCK